MPRRNLLYMKLNALLRHALVYRNANFHNNVVVTEFPKSGGSWICQMLSEASGIPFPRNKLPLVKKQILHGHYLAEKSMITNPIVILRDGRDVAVSFYFHSLFENDKFNGRLVERTNKRLQFKDPNDIEANLPEFLEFIFTEKMFPRYSWSEFTDSWLDVEPISFKYEDFLQQPVDSLISLCRLGAGCEIDRETARSIVDKYSFSKMSKRKPGEENRASFLRKGISGDWENNFTRTSRQLFHEFAGSTLIRCGYEKDDSWLKPND